jgi:2-polyprenyl-3-methyl-5-hydroxy-6-metoxy-1,4-benzoquinol methylase
MAYDVDRAREYALRVWKFKEGDLVARMMRLGDVLGLYRELADAGRCTPDDLASRLGHSERFVREWLYGQAAAGLVEHEDGEFWMIEEARSVLVNEDSLLFAGGALAPSITKEHFDLILDAMRTGVGFTYGAMGEDVAAEMDRSAGAWQRTFLPTVVIPQIEGMPERLRSGARVLEVGCGSGVALAALAAMYPESSFVGLDPSPVAVELATGRVTDLPNAEVLARDAAELGPDGDPFDLVIALDCMHDMPRPDLVAASVRSVISDDGAWLIRDMKTSGSFDADRSNPVIALMYGYSVSSCLPSGASTPDGLALGTLGFGQATVEAMMSDAGFASVRRLDADDPTHHYYEVRP